MTKRISCREAGYDCDFEMSSENEAELVDFTQIHSRSTHDKSPSEDDVRGMMQNA